MDGSTAFLKSLTESRHCKRQYHPPISPSLLGIGCDWTTIAAAQQTTQNIVLSIG
jgi:hypothetical protein